MVQDGWNEDGSFDRLQCSVELTTRAKIEDFIDEALLKFEQGQRSRLDLRIATDLDVSVLTDLRNQFPALEFAAIFNPTHFEQIVKLIVGQNNEARALEEVDVMRIRTAVAEQVNRIIKDRAVVEAYALGKLAEMQNRDYTFARSGFEADELHRLWGNNFDWTLAQCEGIKNANGIYGIRDKTGNLIAALLISDGETTEWAVDADYRGKGLISPLLIASHVDWLNSRKEALPLEVFARYDYSVGPGLKTGLRFADPSGILTNHVTVSSQDKPDFWNIERNDFGDMDGKVLRSFAIGQLDPRLISSRVKDEYAMVLSNL